MARTRCLAWRWRLASSPEAIWPLVADTNRFDRDTGLPEVRRLPAEPLPNGRKRAELRLLGQRVVWVEEPFEWIRPHGFSVQRHYDSGPIARLKAIAELTPDGAGTCVDYRVEADPRGPLGPAVIRVQAGMLAARAFARVIRVYDRVVQSGDALLPPATGPRAAALAPGGAGRLAAAQAELAAQVEPSLVARLVELVRDGDELTLDRLRPHGLAAAWGVPRAAAVDLCLRAVRAGLLRFRWELLCPLCRGANDRPTRLVDVPDEVHCQSCHIDYAVGFEQSVELTFEPAPAVRPLEVRVYCVGGPSRTPHIVAQQLLAAGETRTLDLELEPGGYQLRLGSARGTRPIEVTADAAGEHQVDLAGDWLGEASRLAPASRLTISADSELLVILERTAWRDDALTAAEVLRLQTFRDLFAAEALRPGQPITVGDQTVLFTDLRGSTALYQQVGDAPAFGRVMSHFDLLRDAVAAEGGAIVKTIGDAVMAVFARPIHGVRAMLAAQRSLASSPHDALGLTLKAGLHHGPCIAVTLNDRIDYFGTTVNLAARLEGQSQGADLIVSPPVMADPELVAWLAAEPGLRVEPFTAQLKGFEHETLTCGRLTWD